MPIPFPKPHKAILQITPQKPLVSFKLLIFRWARLSPESGTGVWLRDRAEPGVPVSQHASQGSVLIT